MFQQKSTLIGSSLVYSHGAKAGKPPGIKLFHNTHVPRLGMSVTTQEVLDDSTLQVLDGKLKYV